jgi:hypothetical protein
LLLLRLGTQVTVALDLDFGAFLPVVVGWLLAHLAEAILLDLPLPSKITPHHFSAVLQT